MMDRTKWFAEAGWGVFCHWLVDSKDNVTAEQWNKRVDAFDVPGLVAQLRSINAPYFMLTVGQNSGHWCAPNATYDKLAGVKPSKCSRRDLITELADALAPHGIRMMVYHISGAPTYDAKAIKNLGWKWGFKAADHLGHGWAERRGDRLVPFQRKWEAILRDYSMRWGHKIAGWWIDGCYFADEMYRDKTAPNFKSFAASMRSGNPDAIVAFNPGVYAPIISHTEYEDYTAGEIDLPLPECKGPWVIRDGKKVRWHMMGHVGEHWGSNRLQFSDAALIAYTKYAILNGGAVSWDAPIGANGLIPEPALGQLRKLGDAIADFKRRPVPASRRRAAIAREENTWRTFLEGSNWKALQKTAGREAAAFRRRTPPSLVVPPLAQPLNGDVARVDWSNAPLQPVSRRCGDAYVLPGRHASFQMTHDGSHLYVRMTERAATAKFRSQGAWDVDHWEIFLAPARGSTFRQVGIGFGHSTVGTSALDGTGKWKTLPSARQIISEREWTVEVAIPLSEAIAGGVKPGDTLFMNVIRATNSYYKHLAWSPTFQGGFLDTNRLGAVTLGK